jgi:phage shock protein A
MNLLERVLTLLGINLNTVVEQANDPEHTLHQLQLDMRNQLVQVKTQVATAIAENHKMQKRSQERKAEADTWLKKAELALQQDNDTFAREALSHYNNIHRQIQRYQQQYENQKQLLTTMCNALYQLEAKIADVETTLDLLATQRRNALIQQRIHETLQKTGHPKDAEHTYKTQEPFHNTEAQTQTLADIHNHPSYQHTDHFSTREEIEQQIQAIRQENKQKPHNQQKNTLRRQTSPLTSSPFPLKRDTPPNQELPRQTGPTTSHTLDIEQLKTFLNLPDD